MRNYAGPAEASFNLCDEKMSDTLKEPVALSATPKLVVLAVTTSAILGIATVFHRNEEITTSNGSVKRTIQFAIWNRGQHFASLIYPAQAERIGKAYVPNDQYVQKELL